MPQDKQKIEARYQRLKNQSKGLENITSPISGFLDAQAPDKYGTSYPGKQPVGDLSQAPYDYVQPNGAYVYNNPPTVANFRSGIDVSQGLAAIKPNLSFDAYAAPKIQNDAAAASAAARFGQK